MQYRNTYEKDYINNYFDEIILHWSIVIVTKVIIRSDIAEISYVYKICYQIWFSLNYAYLQMASIFPI